MKELSRFTMALTELYEFCFHESMGSGFCVYKTVLDMIVLQCLFQSLGSGLQLVYRMYDVSALEFNQIGIGFVLIYQ